MARKNWLRTTREQRDEMRNTADASTIAWFFFAAVVLGYLAGLWIDNKFHVAPWGSVIGALLGIVTGFVNLVQVSNRIIRDEDEAARRRREGPSRPNGGADRTDRDNRPQP